MVRGAVASGAEEAGDERVEGVFVVGISCVCEVSASWGWVLSTQGVRTDHDVRLARGVGEYVAAVVVATDDGDVGVSVVETLRYGTE